ncbi:hypothetical protein AX16_001764 [Volvariella volvacea WC 439]|nr:hypothetical protein AX16_001764 [Volvariella volvacea WC 439]
MRSQYLILTFRLILKLRYSLVAAYALQVFDWFVNLQHEIETVYPTRWSLIKWGYLFCRYYPMFLLPVSMWAYINDHPSELCERVIRPVHGLLAPAHFLPHGIMAIRAHAFCGRTRNAKLILGVFYAGLVGIDIWVFCTNPTPISRRFYRAFGNTGCFPNYITRDMRVKMGTSMLAAVLMDFISLACVMIHCRRTKPVQGSLASYFLRQGLMAFAAILAVNAAAAIMYYQNVDESARLIGFPLIFIVSNSIACRVIIKLRRQATPPTESRLLRQASMIVDNALNAIQTMPGSEDAWVVPDRGINTTEIPMHRRRPS